MSAGAGAEGGGSGDGGDKSGTGSSPPLRPPHELDPLPSVGPLPPHLLPPPDPAAGAQ